MMTATHAMDAVKYFDALLSGSNWDTIHRRKEHLSDTAKLVLDRTRKGKWKPKVEHFDTFILREEPSFLDFNKERERCLAQNKLFEDPEFPATIKSICLGSVKKTLSEDVDKIEWLRPGEITKDPQLITEGLSRFDAKQGNLGDCYFVAAMSTLAMHEELFYRVVPLDQSFTKDYAGIFHFHIWHYGKWVDVVVDDRLPTLNGRLLFAESTDKSEFWGSLLEKAYAKIYGSYEAIEIGYSGDAITDLTGEFVHYYELQKTSADKLLNALAKVQEPGIMACCAIGNTKVDHQGLMDSHGYSVTGLWQVSLNNGEKVNLIRIRNPYGDAREWNGRWSDKSDDWKEVRQDEREKLVQKADGEFWMSIADFKNIFAYAVVSTLSIHSKWEFYQMTGKEEWKPNSHYTASIDGRWAKAGIVAKAGAQSKKELTEDLLERACYYVLHMLNAKESSLANSKYTVTFMLTRKYQREQLSSNLNKTLGWATIKDPMLGPQNRDSSAVSSGLEITGNRDLAIEIVTEPGRDYLVYAWVQSVKKEVEFHLRAIADGPFEMRNARSTIPTNIEVKEWIVESAA